MMLVIIVICDSLVVFQKAIVFSRLYGVNGDGLVFFATPIL